MPVNIALSIQAVKEKLIQEWSKGEHSLRLRNDFFARIPNIVPCVAPAIHVANRLLNNTVTCAPDPAKEGPKSAADMKLILAGQVLDNTRLLS
eukprot:231796-Pyramimonas_sp.AAC.1